MDIQLKVRSLNVNGIRRDKKKRMNIFEFLKTRKCIHIITETHCKNKSEGKKWGEEWSGNPDNVIWSHGTSNSKGVGILIDEEYRKENPSLKISDIIRDPNGRYVKCFITLNNVKFRVLGVYAPNKPLERIKFFNDIHSIVNDEEDAENVFGGDWNCTQDSNLDRRCCTSDNDIGQRDLKLISELLNIEDIWRRRNPSIREYTWSARGKKSRIDYFLTSISLNSQIKEIKHTFAPYTDHDAVDISISTEELKRGRGIWKMNTSHLFDPQFKIEFTELWTNWQSRKHEYEDIKIWWDMGKRHIKTFSINFAQRAGQHRQNKLKEIEKIINQRQQDNKDYDNLKKEYEELFSKQTDGARVRSRIQDWEDGERSTKYFFSLEKQRAKEKAWTEILDKQGKLIHGTPNIQKRQTEFYKELFTSQTHRNPDYDYFLSNTQPHRKKLSDESKEALDSDISNEEIIKSLKLIKNNKSPGPDGISTELYKIYWNLIGEDLCDVLKFGLEDQELAYTQYLAIIILLYKKGKREDIRNWRPISLLNSDYKILSKVLANRLKTVLNEIIHQDQKGCIAGRFIGENIRIINDILYEIENSNEDDFIIQLDQEKAYDRVEWEWLFKVLEHFNFGEKFIGYLKTLYKNARSSVLTNGYQSSYFEISRGIRQGDALSALLFIIQFEPLMEKIRKDQQIQGISINLTHINETVSSKGCQYVDDSNSLLRGSNSVDKFYQVINKYELTSGSKVNVDKTVCIAVKENLLNILTQKMKKPSKQEVLGVPVGKQSSEQDVFWETRISKLESKLNIWKSRNLSFQGKVLIIRSQAVSKIMYAAEMIDISKPYVDRIQAILVNFLFSGKRMNIKRDVLFLPRQMGGLNLVNLNILIKVKRIQWIIRWLKCQNNGIWTKMVENYLRCLDNSFDIDFFSIKVTDSSELIKKAKIPNFYKDCIHHFQELNQKSRINDGKDEIIWCNSKHKFLNKPLTFKHWSKSGFKTLSDIFKEGKIQDNTIKPKLKRKAGFYFEKMIVKKAVSLNGNQIVNDGHSFVNAKKEEILNFKYNVPGYGEKTLADLTSKDIYNIFLLKDIPEMKCFNYWKNKLDDENIDWDTWISANIANKITPRNCLDFSWKILHGLINTESKLKIMKLSNGICKMCTSNSSEDLMHLLNECKHARIIWKNIQYIFDKWGVGLKIDSNHIITGFRPRNLTPEADFINAILSITRFHIWKIRNRVKYGQENITIQENINSLKYCIIQHLITLERSKTSGEHEKAASSVLQTIIKDHQFQTTL